MTIDTINKIARLQRLEAALWNTIAKADVCQHAWLKEQIAHTKRKISQLQQQ